MIDPTAKIDDSARVHPDAIIGPGVEIGPWSLVDAGVELGEGCWVGPHVVLRGPTKAGRGNRFFQFSSIGEECQDKKYAGELTRLEIGDNNVFREICTVHRGTVQDNSLTKIGNDNLFMAYTHVAHDCMVGNGIILANNASLAGHVHVGDQAILGGFAGIHQFCRVGAHSFCAVGSVVVKDVPAYVMCAGQNAVPHGINSEGLKRRGFSPEDIRLIKQAYKLVYRQSLTLQQALVKLAELAPESAALQLFITSLEQSSRGIIR